MAAGRQPVRTAAPPQRRAVVPVRPLVRPPPVMSSAAALQSRIGASGMQQILRRAAGPAPSPVRGAPAMAGTAGPAPPAVSAAPATATAAPVKAGAAPATPAQTAATPPQGTTTLATAAAPTTPAKVGAPGASGGPGGPVPPGAAGAAAAAGPTAEAAAMAAKAAPLRPARPSPALTKLNAKVAGEAGKQAKHPPAADPVASAQAAAVAPGPAAQAAAAEAAVKGMAGVPTTTVEKAAFKTALKQKLNEKMPAPNSAEEAEKTLQSGTAQSVGAEMKGELAAQKTKATGGLPAAAQAAPDPAAFKKEAPPPVAPLPTAAPMANPGGAGVAPAPLPQAALDTSAQSATSANQLAANNITETQLKKSNEPSFAAASDARAQAAEHSATAPAAVRDAETGIRAGAAAEGAVLVGKGLAGMVGSRVGGFGKVAGQQAATKSKDEQERQRIARALDDIQSKTRTEVTVILDEMDKGAGERFDAGLKEALAAFDARREELERRARLERAESWMGYLGPLGAAIGYFWSLGKEQVDAAIAGARNAYNAVVDRLIDEVADFVGTKLAEAKVRIAQGRADAEKFVAEQPANVRKIGEEALAKVNEQFDTLAGEIDERRDGLLNALGDKYAAACAEVDAKAQAFRDENKSLWDRAKEAVAGVINTLLELKALLVAIAVKAAGVVQKILDDPIQFLKNLVTGVKQGLQAFVSNFLTHLKAGLFTWMFGTLSAAGIQLPERFDAKGIFGLIASVLGLTYSNIRARAVLQLGEPMVARLETVAEVFKVLITEGPMGLWNMLIDKLAQLKEQVLTQIREMLMVQVIKAGIVWLIGLLNPASAFIKACKAIYDVVMFFIEKGKQIADFVNAVLDSLDAIASGRLGGVAKMVEGALAKMVPVVIGFLASLLGLGGLSEKIKTIVEKIQAPVNKAIDWLISKAVGLVKFVGKKGKEAAKALIGWAKAKVGFKDANGQSHSIYVDEVGGRARLMIASSPQAALKFLEAYKAMRLKDDPNFLTTSAAEIAAAEAAIAASDAQVQVADKLDADKTPAGVAAYDAALGILLKLNVTLSGALAKLIKDDTKVGKSQEKYLLEGLTGTYASMPKAVGDKLTPDHQPQAAVLEAAAEFKSFKKSGEMQTRAGRRAHHGFAINLHYLRHIAGRTFGPDGKKTKKDFETWAANNVNKSEPEEDQRAKVVGRLKADLKADAAKIVSALSDDKNFADLKTEFPNDDKTQKEVRAGITSRVIKGEAQMESQDLDSLAK